MMENDIEQELHRVLLGMALRVALLARITDPTPALRDRIHDELPEINARYKEAVAIAGDDSQPFLERAIAIGTIEECCLGYELILNAAVDDGSLPPAHTGVGPAGSE